MIEQKVSPYAMPGFKFRPTLTNKYDSEAVIKIVLDFFCIDEDYITKRDSTIPSVYKRSVLFFILYFDTKLTYKQIGARFGNRDHTSVRNSIVQLNKELSKKDSQFDYAKDIQNIRQLLF